MNEGFRERGASLSHPPLRNLHRGRTRHRSAAALDHLAWLVGVLIDGASVFPCAWLFGLTVDRILRGDWPRFLRFLLVGAWLLSLYILSQTLNGITQAEVIMLFDTELASDANTFSAELSSGRGSYMEIVSAFFGFTLGKARADRRRATP